MPPVNIEPTQTNPQLYQKPRSRRPLIIVGIIILVLVVLGAVGWILWQNMDHQHKEGIQGPAAPTAGVVFDTQIMVFWKSPTETAKYTLQCSASKDFKGAKSINVVGGSGSCDDLKAGTIYYARYAAESGSQAAQWSAVLETKTTITLSNPTDLRVTATSATTANYSWTAISGATLYQLQRSTDGQYTDNTVTLPVTEATGEVVALTPGMTYYFRVRALNSSPAGNLTPYSPSIIVKTPAQ